jgi:hypothetical protein
VALKLIFVLLELQPVFLRDPFKVLYAPSLGLRSPNNLGLDENVQLTLRILVVDTTEPPM